MTMTRRDVGKALAGLAATFGIGGVAKAATPEPTPKELAKHLGADLVDSSWDDLADEIGQVRKLTGQAKRLAEAAKGPSYNQKLGMTDNEIAKRAEEWPPGAYLGGGKVWIDGKPVEAQVASMDVHFQPTSQLRHGIGGEVYGLDRGYDSSDIEISFYATPELTDQINEMVNTAKPMKLRLEHGNEAPTYTIDRAFFTAMTPIFDLGADQDMKVQVCFSGGKVLMEMVG